MENYKEEASTVGESGFRLTNLTGFLLRVVIRHHLRVGGGCGTQSDFRMIRYQGRMGFG